ncbi:MAG: adenylylsulfate kinase [Bacteroidia bacterium]|jgi:adenylylsulfate kinase
MNNNIQQSLLVTKHQREGLLNQKSLLIWFTGLSGSGKSTIANLLEEKLHKKGHLTYLLDGDNVRNGINKDLTFSAEDRSTNIRRIAEVAKLFLDSGVVVLASFISPFQKDRSFVKDLVGADNYMEVYVNTPLEECEKRDVKGLYAKARAGTIPFFTGITSPYEPPEHSDLTINTMEVSEIEAVDLVYNAALERITR